MRAVALLVGALVFLVIIIVVVVVVVVVGLAVEGVSSECLSAKGLSRVARIEVGLMMGLRVKSFARQHRCNIGFLSEPHLCPAPRNSSCGGLSFVFSVSLNEAAGLVAARGVYTVVGLSVFDLVQT